MPKPIWYLDFDGVINADLPDPYTWPLDTWRHLRHRGTTVERYPRDVNFPIVYATPVIQFINFAHHSGKVDIYWHTTWQTQIQTLARRIGLPALRIADNRPIIGRREIEWWKLEEVAVSLAAGNTVIWTDDDTASTLSVGLRWALNRLPGTLHTITPNPARGLTPADLTTIGNIIFGEDKE